MSEVKQPEGIFITNEQARAVNILLAAASVAQKAGAFSLQDANAVYEAVMTFKVEKPEEETTEEQASA